MLAGMLAGPAFFKSLPPHHGLMGCHRQLRWINNEDDLEAAIIYVNEAQDRKGRDDG
jgi:hypothetical protein